MPFVYIYTTATYHKNRNHLSDKRGFKMWVKPPTVCTDLDKATRLLEADVQQCISRCNESNDPVKQQEIGKFAAGDRHAIIETATTVYFYRITTDNF